MTKKGVFVSSRSFVEGTKGGVQVCTREYIDTLEGAGFDLTYQLFDGDRRLTTRIRRRLSASAYFRPSEPELAPRIEAAVQQTKASHVFLNQTTLASLAPALKAAIPDCKIVVLSHGLESTDLLHQLRLRRAMPISVNAHRSPALAMGSTLLDEARFRPFIDAVCAISPFDADLEKWLGTTHAFWVPRTIRAAPLDWRPRRGRFGLVGTLDHAPNLEGLLRVLDVFGHGDAGDIRIRVVGGPDRLGAWLANKYPIVDYLGPLGDDELTVEAASWNAFLHPIFFLARGCSTKLATALAWQIPIVTTGFGHRGYVWTRGRLTIGDSPAEFVRQCIELLEEPRAAKARKDVIDVARTSPTIQENAERLLENLTDRQF